MDYLVDEVLQRQPEHIRRFLLQTSILDRLSGPLCDAVTSQEEGGVLLETLERSNLFVIPLDDKRQWYRYHHLFGDVLQAHLMKEQPEGIAALHQRASEWYEDNGLTADAVHHAFAAGDLARAARIIELAWAEMDRNRQAARMAGLGKKAARRTGPRPACAQRWLCLGLSGYRRHGGRRDVAATKPNTAWKQRQISSSQMKRNFDICREALPLPAPIMRWRWAICPPP